MLYYDESENTLHISANDDKPVTGDAAISGHGETDAEEEPSTGEALAARGGSLPAASCISDAAGPTSGPSNTQYMTYKPPERRMIQTLIDYFKVRFDFPYCLSAKEPEIREMCLNILQVFYVTPDMEVQLKHGGSHYEKGYQFGENFFIFSEGTDTRVHGMDTMLIELKGDSIRSLMRRGATHERYISHNKDADENDPKFQRWVWCKIFAVIEKYPHRVTRIDVPTDDFSGIIPLEELKYKCLHKHYVSRMRKPSLEREVTDGESDEVEEYAKEHQNGKKGWSFTLGRRTSASQLCIYDKKAEMDASGAGIVLAAQWLRFESRFYKDNAEELFPKLKTAYESEDSLAAQRFIVGCLAALIEFKDRRLTSDNTYKADTWEPWKVLIAQADVLQFASLAYKTLTIKGNAIWLAKAGDRTIDRVLIAYAEDVIDVIRYLIVDGLPKCDKVDLEIANEMRGQIGREKFGDLGTPLAIIFNTVNGGKLPCDDVLRLFDDKTVVEIKPINTDKKEGE